jgi:RNA polymerase sigma factor (sigma-70 family)
MTYIDTAPALGNSNHSEQNGHEILTVEETFQQYFSVLVRYAKKFFVADPEATVMDVFERAVKEKERKGPDVKLHPGWYFWVTHNVALNEQRKLARREENLVDCGPGSYAAETPDYSSEDAFGNIEFEEIMQHVDRILADKPPHWIAIVGKRALHGDQYAEIGEDLGIAAGTVGSAYARAKAALRADETLRSAAGRE